MKQKTFASMEHEGKKKQTKRELFLNEMERVIPWDALQNVIEPHYPKAGKGRPPYEMKIMLRIYFMQQWYGLSDPGMEEALYEIASMRRFAGLEMWHEALPDESAILRFRHLLERHGLTEQLLNVVNAHLVENKLLLRTGTIVDATLIAAPPSTKNSEGKRDPEMSSTKKGNNWYFGMKIHSGVDASSGLVHTVAVTTASVHDKTAMPKLLHGDERIVLGDKGYVSDTDKRDARQRGVIWGVLDKAKPKHTLSTKQTRRNRKLSSVRAKVEHPFRVIKRQFGYMKVRYKGLLKNTVQVFTLFALANLYMARKKLLCLQEQSVLKMQMR
jgi:IS5 family transposase